MPEVVQIERTPPHPAAVLAVRLAGDDGDPIPYRPGLFETHLGATCEVCGGLLKAHNRDCRLPLDALRAPQSPSNGRATQGPPQVFPGPYTGLLARLEAIERRVETLDDDVGACLEAHEARLEALETPAADPAADEEDDGLRFAARQALEWLAVAETRLLGPEVREAVTEAVEALHAGLGDAP